MYRDAQDRGWLPGMAQSGDGIRESVRTGVCNIRTHVKATWMWKPACCSSSVHGRWRWGNGHSKLTRHRLKLQPTSSVRDPASVHKVESSQGQKSALGQPRVLTHVYTDVHSPTHKYANAHAYHTQIHANKCIMTNSVFNRSVALLARATFFFVNEHLQLFFFFFFFQLL